jgi:hypothetical protein
VQKLGASALRLKSPLDLREICDVVHCGADSLK